MKSLLRALLLSLALLMALLVGAWILNLRLGRDSGEAAPLPQLLTRVQEVVFSSRQEGMLSMAKLEPLVGVAQGREPADAPAVLVILETARRIFDAELVYVLDASGTVVACTTYEDGKTLTGQHFAFRSYVKEALEGKVGIHPAVGVVTGARGLYFSVPVKAGQGSPVGVLVVKVGLGAIDLILATQPTPVFLLSPDQVVFASNRADLLYTCLKPDVDMARLREERTFGAMALTPFPGKMGRGGRVEFEGQSLRLERQPLMNEWTLASLTPAMGTYAVDRRVLLAGGGLLVLMSLVILALLALLWERYRHERELKASRALFQSLFNLAPDGICITSMEGNLLSWNGAFQRLFGYPEEALRTLKAQALYQDPVQDRPALLAELAAHGSVSAREIPMKDAQGRARIISVSLTQIEDQGRPCLEAICRDMTEARSLEQQLVRAQKLETVGTLVSGIAHDFNNALSGVLGYLSLIRSGMEEAGVSGELAAFTEKAEAAGCRATGMIRQLLAFARKRDLAMEPVDLQQVVEAVAGLCSNALDKTVELVVRREPGAAWVRADAGQLEQSLLNLCINGEHAMTLMRAEGEAQGGRLTIALERATGAELQGAEPGRTYWRLSVEDTGVGIPREHLDKVFDPFFTSKPNQKGTGLGLAMTQRIVHLHGGFCAVETEVGKGSRFSLFLPAWEGSLPSMAMGAEHQVPRGEGTVLVVDDEALLRALAHDLLTACGYTVVSAANGTEALQAFHPGIRLVLLDVHMPGLTGPAVLQRLRRLDPRVRILFTSGDWDQDLRAQLEALGPQGFLAKPFTLEGMAQAVKRALEA